MCSCMKHCLPFQCLIEFRLAYYLNIERKFLSTTASPPVTFFVAVVCQLSLSMETRQSDNHLESAENKDKNKRFVGGKARD